jgi:hypothetical protein
MLAMLKRHEVEILLKAGQAKTEVARLSGVSLRTGNRIAEERPVEHVDDAKACQNFRNRQVYRAASRKSVAEHSNVKAGSLFHALHRMEQAGWLLLLWRIGNQRALRNSIR